MPGPPSNPHKPRSRGRTTKVIVTLPAEGCDLEPPPLPRGRRWTSIDREWWEDLWKSPQAVMWDDSAATLVAAYIIHQRHVMSGNAGAWQAQEARHLADRLGLTPQGMASLGWRIAEPTEVADVVTLRGVS